MTPDGKQAMSQMDAMETALWHALGTLQEVELRDKVQVRNFGPIAALRPDNGGNMTSTSYIKTCPVCHRNFVPSLSMDVDFQAKLRRWNHGAYVQEVWPWATPMQREQIISGICSDRCWDALYMDADADADAEEPAQ
jgi:hypothetical protein